MEISIEYHIVPQFRKDGKFIIFIRNSYHDIGRIEEQRICGINNVDFNGIFIDAFSIKAHGRANNTGGAYIGNHMQIFAVP